MAQIKAHIGGNLVITRAAGMQAFAGIPYQCGQAFFDIEMHIFQVE